VDGPPVKTNSTSSMWLESLDARARLAQQDEASGGVRAPSGAVERRDQSRGADLMQQLGAGWRAGEGDDDE